MGSSLIFYLDSLLVVSLTEVYQFYFSLTKNRKSALGFIGLCVSLFYSIFSLIFTISFLMTLGFVILFLIPLGIH